MYKSPYAPAHGWVPSRDGGRILEAHTPAGKRLSEQMAQRDTPPKNSTFSKMLEHLTIESESAAKHRQFIDQCRSSIFQSSWSMGFEEKEVHGRLLPATDPIRVKRKRVADEARRLLALPDPPQRFAEGLVKMKIPSASQKTRDLLKSGMTATIPPHGFNVAKIPIDDVVIALGNRGLSTRAPVPRILRARLQKVLDQERRADAKERRRRKREQVANWKLDLYNEHTMPKHAKKGFMEAPRLINRAEAQKTYAQVNRVSAALNNGIHRYNAQVKLDWAAQRRRAARKKAADELAAADPYNFMTWWEKEAYWENRRKAGPPKNKFGDMNMEDEFSEQEGEEEEAEGADSRPGSNRSRPGSKRSPTRKKKEKKKKKKKLTAEEVAAAKVRPYKVMVEKMLSQVQDILGHPLNVHRMPIEEVKFELLARDVELIGSEHDLRMKLDALLDTRNCLYVVDCSCLSIEEVDEQLEARGHNLMGDEPRRRRRLGGALVKELPRHEFENYPQVNVFKIPIEDVVYELRNRAMEIRGPPDALRIRLKKVLAEERRREDRVTPIDVSILSYEEMYDELDKRQMSVQGTKEMMAHRIGLRLAVEEANKEERVNVVHHQLTTALVALKSSKGSKSKTAAAIELVKACVLPFAVLKDAEGLRKWLSNKKLFAKLRSVAHAVAKDWRETKRARAQEDSWRRKVAVQEIALEQAGCEQFDMLEEMLREATAARDASNDDAIESKQWTAFAVRQAFAACEYANYCAEKAAMTAARAHEIYEKEQADQRAYRAHLRAISLKINKGLDLRKAANDDALQGVQIRCRAAEIAEVRRIAAPVQKKFDALPELQMIERPQTPRKENPERVIDEDMRRRRAQRKELKAERERKRKIRDAQRAEQIKRQLIEKERLKALERANMSGFSKKADPNKPVESAEQRAERQVRERRAKLKARKKESKRRKQLALEQMEAKAKLKAGLRAQALRSQLGPPPKEVIKPGSRPVSKAGSRPGTQQASRSKSRPGTAMASVRE